MTCRAHAEGSCGAGPEGLPGAVPSLNLPGHGRHPGANGAPSDRDSVASTPSDVALIGGAPLPDSGRRRATLSDDLFNFQKDRGARTETETIFTGDEGLNRPGP